MKKKQVLKEEIKRIDREIEEIVKRALNIEGTIKIGEIKQL